MSTSKPIRFIYSICFIVFGIFWLKSNGTLSVNDFVESISFDRATRQKSKPFSSVAALMFILYGAYTLKDVFTKDS